MNINRFYATRGTYQLPSTIIEGGGGLTLGRGIDMTDPQAPVLVPDLNQFFGDKMVLMAADEGYEVSGDNIKDTFALLQTDTVESEAQTLNVYFRASYASVASVSGAVEFARSARRESHSAYVLLTHAGDSRVMSPRLWHARSDLKPTSETMADDERAFVQFRRDFGTHYIHAITYGLTIAIRGSLRSNNEDERKKLGSRLKGGFGAFNAEGGIDATTGKQLNSADLELTTEVNCGGTVPPRPLSMSNYQDIAKFLKDLHSGEVRFKLAPISLHVASYWNLLDPQRLPRCRALLDPVQFGTEFAPPAGAFGVPAGTIVAWRPTNAHIENVDDTAKAVIRAPNGWALCDGQNGLPDLRGKFVRGTDRLSAVGVTGGAESHNHNVAAGTVARVSGLVTAKMSALVSIDNPAQPNLPPYFELVYIIKLDETP